VGARAGLAVDVFARGLSFFFNAHSDFFEEIAKYRAARRIWARVMRDRFGAPRTSEAGNIRFHRRPRVLSDLAAAYNNVHDGGSGVIAVLGGCQSLQPNSLDEAYALPSEHAVTLALRTQQILAHETASRKLRIRLAAVTISSNSPIRGKRPRLNTSSRSTKWAE
jgi:methylmalonyl-CoA mutase N-terminal domain/subunit